MISRLRFLQLLGFSALSGTYPLLIERNMVLENHYDLAFNNFPLSFNDIKIVHLSDIHFGHLVSKTFVESVIHRINQLKADIVLCTGDYVHTSKYKNDIDIVWPIICKLRAKIGIFSVLGNHDHWADTDRSLYWLNRSGHSIRHKVQKISRGSDSIWIGGAGDLWEDDLAIDRTFRNVPSNDFKILLAHNPDSVDQKFKTRIDLALSGHTHGGQVIIPFYGPPIIPVKNKKYTSGLIKLHDSSLFISKGIGWAVLPIRVNCYPEIAVLHLIKNMDSLSAQCHFA